MQTTLALKMTHISVLDLLLSYQCRRRAWRNADRPSITRRMDTVRTANRPNIGTRNKTPRLFSVRSPTRITMVHSTSDSSVKAEKEASETQQKQNSICYSLLLRSAIDFRLYILSRPASAQFTLLHIRKATLCFYCVVEVVDGTNTTTPFCPIFEWPSNKHTDSGLKRKSSGFLKWGCMR